jgi:hypothetical protein
MKAIRIPFILFCWNDFKNDFPLLYKYRISNSIILNLLNVQFNYFTISNFVLLFCLSLFTHQIASNAFCLSVFAFYYIRTGKRNNATEQCNHLTAKSIMLTFHLQCIFIYILWLNKFWLWVTLSNFWTILSNVKYNNLIMWICDNAGQSDIYLYPIIQSAKLFSVSFYSF